MLDLSHALRTTTRPDHQRAETAFALQDWTRDRTAYGRLLGTLRSFYEPAEHRLRAISEWQRLSPPVDPWTRERAHLLVRDLADLGVQPETGAPAESSSSPYSSPSSAPDRLTTGLGWLYVLEGSRLGGRVIAGQARAALGDDLPVSFFTASGRPAGPDWHALQRALDTFGVGAGRESCTEVVAAARAAFAAFVACLSQGVGQL